MSFSVTAQVNPGARFTSMASAGVAVSDAWSMQQNQAGLAAIDKTTIAFAIEKPFAGFDLSTQSVLMIFPHQGHVFGISFQRYGVAAYTEQRAAFCYARRFGNRLSAALNFNYHLLKIPSYGSAQTYSVETGIQYRLNSHVALAAHVANPSQSKFGEYSDSLIPVRFQLGASFDFSDKVLLAAALQKTAGLPLDNKIGLEYRIIDVLALRGGVSTSPFKHYAGFGINYQKLKMDVATSSQPLVGFSPQIAMSYVF